jgi:hypothetical protein
MFQEPDRTSPLGGDRRPPLCLPPGNSIWPLILWVNPVQEFLSLSTVVLGVTLPPIVQAHPMQTGALLSRTYALQTQLSVSTEVASLSLNEICGRFSGLWSFRSLSPLPSTSLATLFWTYADLHSGEYITGLHLTWEKRAYHINHVNYTSHPAAAPGLPGEAPALWAFLGKTNRSWVGRKILFCISRLARSLHVCTCACVCLCLGVRERARGYFYYWRLCVS